MAQYCHARPERTISTSLCLAKLGLNDTRELGVGAVVRWWVNNTMQLPQHRVRDMDNTGSALSKSVYYRQIDRESCV